MTRNDRKRRLMRRRAHGRDMAERRQHALETAEDVARQRKKGKKGVETAMKFAGYVPHTRVVKVRGTEPRVVIDEETGVTRHLTPLPEQVAYTGWLRRPQVAKV